MYMSGVYISSIQGCLYTLRIFFAYFFIALGFLSLLTGIFWSICHGMKCRMYTEQRRRQPDNRVHVSTVDRPDFYPPSYEESQCTSDAHIETSRACEVPLCAAPPLYTQSSSDTVNVDFSHEEPPTYQQAVL
ncbi:transmembrane protein 252-like [Myxocyprinus asiaticus]|uniref:transmembrane protein 252-like n=1 Tax=Myxocyprinus asiaticus TaxID=70543 RepID=UPI00222291F2|nr:transmembrane protein 252-like [Myxocyprinus asiaticus]